MSIDLSWFTSVTNAQVSMVSISLWFYNNLDKICWPVIFQRTIWFEAMRPYTFSGHICGLWGPQRRYSSPEKDNAVQRQTNRANNKSHHQIRHQKYHHHQKTTQQRTPDKNLDEREHCFPGLSVATDWLSNFRSVVKMWMGGVSFGMLYNASTLCSRICVSHLTFFTINLNFSVLAEKLWFLGLPPAFSLLSSRSHTLFHRKLLPQRFCLVQYVGLLPQIDDFQPI